MSDAELLSGNAGRVIRGGATRAAGYAAGSLALMGASVVLLRHLSVTDVGRYVTVMSLLAIAGSLSDTGLTVIGQREYATAQESAARRNVLGSILGARLILAPLAVVAAALFALLAGYDHTMVRGTLIAGTGIVLVAVATTLSLPLSNALRLGAVTASEGVRQLVTAFGLVLLAVLGAGLEPFFAVSCAAGLAGVVVTLALAGSPARVAPRLQRRHWAPLLRDAAPVAIALVLGVLYVRGLVILTSLTTSAVQTGYFATSFRLLEVIAPISILLTSSVFPLLARAAAARDDEQLRSALTRTAQVVLLFVLALVLFVLFAARPVVETLVGPSYAGAIAPLRIGVVALAAGFLTQVWVTALVAIREQRALVLTNLLALASVVVLGFALVPSGGARGAAIASLTGESVLCLATLGMLLRARPALGPGWSWVLRPGAAALLGGLCGLALPAPALARGIVAVAVFAAASGPLSAVPRDLRAAFLPAKRRDG